MGGSVSSIVVASIGRQVLPATDPETPASLLWFATIQGMEREQDLTGLAPKDGFIPAQTVERVTSPTIRELACRCSIRFPAGSPCSAKR